MSTVGPTRPQEEATPRQVESRGVKKGSTSPQEYLLERFPSVRRAAPTYQGSAPVGRRANTLRPALRKLCEGEQHPNTRPYQRPYQRPNQAGRRQVQESGGISHHAGSSAGPDTAHNHNSAVTGLGLEVIEVLLSQVANHNSAVTGLGSEVIEVLSRFAQNRDARRWETGANGRPNAASRGFLHQLRTQRQRRGPLRPCMGSSHTNRRGGNARRTTRTLNESKAPGIHHDPEGGSSNSPATQAPLPLPTPALIFDETTNPNLLRTLRPATDPGLRTGNNNNDNNNDNDDDDADDADGLQAPFALRADNLSSVLADRAAPAGLRYASMRLALVTETLEIETPGTGVARVTHRGDGLQGAPLRLLPESRRELNG
ncbi:hypothetical protein MYCTH_2113259 [Thermothelomyces thermophilus ATCC 42464]|uniref:Uncharacterized protein n=1 Tax=Thermothelomyces thermophilus (strain ATCC 42464 / BCRC 31852 / DSM 1799) TaxID=573729 RepID=G2QP05_THET4|nr:uncharacterized protein MYCTH_2113259 [Thermothelomyces thermophilus ATCC 42464]AEO61326.1 hypothetical protein MYCTH_2113259 [Thermothelomyces thermophilus ATCC 42464]